MKIFSLNPDTGKYFEDDSKYVNDTDSLYQGIYNYTLVYPLYTVSSNRFNYLSGKTEITFYTMLPVKRLFQNYLVEINYSFMIDVNNKDFINRCIAEFNSFCEMNKKELNVNSLIP